MHHNVTPCTVCGLPMLGCPDDDITCADCDRLNLAGDPWRHPPSQQHHPLPWWQAARLPLARYADGQRALAFIQGPWAWHEEHGIVERTDVPPG